MKVTFGTCSFDDESHKLLRDGKEVDLARQAYEVLKLLIDESPKAVATATLFEKVWGPDIHLQGNPLHRVISEVRKAIGDDARRPQFVKVIPKFGYAFDGPIIRGVSPDLPASTQPARCWLQLGAREFPLHEGTNIIGRHPDSDVPLRESRVSRKHAQIVVSDEQVFLEDRNSKHGTSHRGQTITSIVPLNDGDEIDIGESRLTFRLVRTSDLSETQ